MYSVFTANLLYILEFHRLGNVFFQETVALIHPGSQYGMGVKNKKVCSQHGTNFLQENWREVHSQGFEPWTH